MVYFKVLLNNKRPTSSDTYPIVVRVTYNRNNTTFTTGVKIKTNLWDETSLTIKHTHPNSQALNKIVSDFSNKIQKEAYKLVNSESFSFEKLKASLTSNASKHSPIERVTFKNYGDKLVNEMLAINKAGNAIVYRTAINKLLEYNNTKELTFNDISYTFLKGFKDYLIKSGLKANSISNYFRTIRAIYNKAIKDKLVSRSEYPFLDITVKTEKTAKRALSVGDIVKMYNSNYKINSAKWHARNYFFLSFGLRGASFTDIAYLTSSNINLKRLVYHRRKTHSQLSIQLLPLTANILELYKGKSEKYLVPVLPKSITEDSLNAKRVIAQWIKTTNKWLSRIAIDNDIDADVTTYVTRHSWATVAKRLGFSNELIAECLGHQYGNKITNIYLDTFDQHVVDEVNVKVLLCLEPCTKQLKQLYQYVFKFKPMMIPVKNLYLLQ